MTPFEIWAQENLPGLRQIQSQGAFRPRPTLAPVSQRRRRPPQPTRRTAAGVRRGALDDWFDSIKGETELEQAERGGFFQNNWLGRGLGGIINVIDTPRALYATAAAGARAAGVPSFLNYTPAGLTAGLVDALGSSEEEQKKIVEAQRDAFRTRAGFREVSGLNETSLPGWMKGVVGFAGDVAYDPLLFVGVGPAAKSAQVVGRGLTRGVGSDVLTSALRTGSRKDIATALARSGENIAQQAGVRAANIGPTVNWATVGQALAERRTVVQAQSFAKEIAGELSLQAGRRGRGALTRKGLARSAERLNRRGLKFVGTPDEIARSRAALGLAGDAAEVSVDDIAKVMDLDLLFGYGFRAPGKAPGEGRLFFSGLAEMRENVVGTLKLNASNMPISSTFRQIVNTSEFNYNKFIDDLIRGGSDVGGKYDAEKLLDVQVGGSAVVSRTAETQLQLARDIGNVLIARRVMRQYAHDGAVRLVNDLQQANVASAENLKAFRRGPLRGIKLTREQLDLIRREMEAAPGSSTLGPVSQVLRNTLDRVFNDLQAAGVRLPYRRGYLPHVVSNDGRRFLQTLDDDTLIMMGVERQATFAMPRNWTAGNDMMFPDGSTVTLVDGSIDEINGLWREWAKRTKQKNADKFTFLNDDPLDIVSGYIAQAAEQMGRQTIIRRVAEQNRGSWIRSRASLETAEQQFKTAGKAEKAARAQLAEGQEVQAVAAKEIMEDVRVRSQADMEGATEAYKYGQSARRQKEKTLVDTQAQKTAAAAELDRVVKYRDSLKAKRGGFTSAARASRRAANKRALELDKQADVFGVRLKEYEDRVEWLRSTQRGSFDARRQREIEKAQGHIRVLQSRIDEDRLAAKNLRESLTDAEADSIRLGNDIEALDLRFGLLDEKIGKIDSRIAYEQADLETLGKRLDQVKAWLDALGPVRSPSSASGRRGRVIGKLSPDKNLRAQQVEIISDRAHLVRSMLDDPEFQGVFGRLEAQRAALEVELDARNLVDEARNVRLKGQELDALDDPEFIAYLQTKLSDDFVAYTQEYNIPKDLIKQYEVELQNYSTWFELWLRKSGASRDAARSALRIRDSLRSAMNWWKSWAVGSPGFVSRNLQGGLFNMYLDGVDAESFRLFTLAYMAYAKGDLGESLWKNRAARYLAADPAVKRAAAQSGSTPEVFARNIVDNEFSEALNVAHATGMGQAAVEVSRGTSTAKRRESALKLWKADNQYTGSIRDLATHSEAVMRGAHAFDVLKKGGDYESAVGRVTKFHFNYADIGGLDRTMKTIIPFWMFFSRNLVLQAEVWTKMPAKLNRTYFNAVRNFEDVDGGREPRFDYFNEMGLIQTGIRVGGDRVHVGADLPPTRLQTDLNTLFPEPTRILSDSYPWFKLPIENMFDKNLFYDAPFRDSHVERAVGKDGNWVVRPRTAPGWLNNPVIRPLFDALPIPGFSNIGGELTLTDRAENTLRQFPPYQRLAGLVFPAERDAKNFGPRLFSFLTGVQARPNTQEMQRQVGEGDVRVEEQLARVERDRQAALEYILENK